MHHGSIRGALVRAQQPVDAEDVSDFGTSNPERRSLGALTLSPRLCDLRCFAPLYSRRRLYGFANRFWSLIVNWRRACSRNEEVLPGDFVEDHVAMRNLARRPLPPA